MSRQSTAKQEAHEASLTAQVSQLTAELEGVQSEVNTLQVERDQALASLRQEQQTHATQTTELHTELQSVRAQSDLNTNRCREVEGTVRA
jgi:predicted  nucleic acid-binding Zn-ribbon protein